MAHVTFKGSRLEVGSDQPGDKLIVGVYLDDEGRINGTRWCCDKPDCNCVGGWTSGSSEGDFYKVENDSDGSDDYHCRAED